tara:strand:+ start:20 stop:721 length:702 start_codon:yes stop_codon:yes gene_type:complete
MDNKFLELSNENNKTNLRTFLNFYKELREDTKKEELYLIWLTDRPGYVSKSHYFIIHKFYYKSQMKFNIYQSWLGKKTWCQIDYEHNTRNLSYDELNSKYIKKLLDILLPIYLEDDPLIEPGGLPSKRKYYYKVPKSLIWSAKDEEIFNSIPGFDSGKELFSPQSYESNKLIKPLFIYHKTNISTFNLKDNIEKFLITAIEQVNSNIAYPKAFNNKKKEDIITEITELLDTIS